MSFLYSYQSVTIEKAKKYLIWDTVRTRFALRVQRKKLNKAAKQRRARTGRR